MGKRHQIGLGNLAAICQMPEQERLQVLAEGLPTILASAEGFQGAAESLGDRPRESDVLIGFAEEEAAKVLILLDMLRCPRAMRSQKVGGFVTRFYDHLSRLIYVASLDWAPCDKGQLRAYVDRRRLSHTTDGAVGEYIVPNGPIPERERRLYADLERHDDGSLTWNEPRSSAYGAVGALWFDPAPKALRLARAMQRLGMFSSVSLKIVGDVWGAHPLTDAMTWQEARHLTLQMLKSLEENGAIPDDATDDDASFLINDWPLPMWDFDLSLVVVPLDELEAERDRNLWNEARY